MFAGLIGLYYYHGCDHADYNWTQEIEGVGAFDGKNETIRMRVPNPNYILDNSSGQFIGRMGFFETQLVHAFLSWYFV